MQQLKIFCKSGKGNSDLINFQKKIYTDYQTIDGIASN